MLHAKFGEEWSSITLEEDEYVQLLMHDDDGQIPIAVTQVT